MATISETAKNLEALKSVKEDIKSAIEGKGQDLTNVPFTEYSNKINEITTKEDLDAELDEQEALLVDLRTKVNELPNKPDIDLSKTTATADDVFQGKQFYNAQGEFVEGGYKDMLNRRLAVKKSCSELFLSFTDEDMSWVNKLDTTGVTAMNSMFSGCRNAKIIDVSKFNTSNVKKMNYMFNDCQAVLELDCSSFDTKNVTSMDAMFFQNFALQKLDVSNFDTSNVTSADSMFYNCTALKTLDLSSFDMGKFNDTTSLFYGCSALEDVTLKNIKFSLRFYQSPKLSNETLINIFKELWDLTGSTSQTLSLSSKSKTNIANIYVKLIEVTDEMIANDPYITNKKPCVVCESTDEGAMTLTEYMILKNWSLA